jgi:hypothetical protein
MRPPRQLCVRGRAPKRAGGRDDRNAPGDVRGACSRPPIPHPIRHPNLRFAAAK